jgi:hypothetical protein
MIHLKGFRPAFPENLGLVTKRPIELASNTKKNCKKRKKKFLELFGIDPEALRL